MFSLSLSLSLISLQWSYTWESINTYYGSLPSTISFWRKVLSSSLTLKLTCVLCTCSILQVNDIHQADSCKVIPAKFCGSKEIVPLHFRKVRSLLIILWILISSLLVPRVESWFQLIFVFILTLDILLSIGCHDFTKAVSNMSYTIRCYSICQAQNSYIMKYEVFMEKPVHPGYVMIYLWQWIIRVPFSENYPLYLYVHYSSHENCLRSSCLCTRDLTTRFWSTCLKDY